MPQMSEKTYHIALAGCPNAGKTALFNRLTGSSQKVANYAGVTVECKQGKLVTPAKNHAQLYDIPGCYSLISGAPDEKIAHQLIEKIPDTNQPPDLIICVADATNLALHLRFALELKALGIPMILALNMADIAKHQSLPIHVKRLSEILGIVVVQTIAVRRGKLDDLLHEIDRFFDKETTPEQPHTKQITAAKTLPALHKESLEILKKAGMRPGLTPKSTYRIDRVLLHPILGFAFLIGMMFLIFQAVFSWAIWPMDQLEQAISLLSTLVDTSMAEGYFKSFLIDGVITGVGSVLIFLPQILILFFFILLLEDSGYLARAAFMLDRIMGGVGLNGRSFIPLLSSFACAIPGIMATRTIADKQNRLITMLIAPLMTCSARLPVYTLIIAAFIPPQSVYGFNLQGIVMFVLYLSGMGFGMLSALFMKRFIFHNMPQHFAMELPSYKLPSLRNIAFGLLTRIRIFLRRAGTIIFAVSVILWLLVSFPIAPENATSPILYSAAGMLGQWLEPLFAPIGFNWQMAIALIPGLAAREVAIAALATVYAVSDQGAGIESGLSDLLAASWSLPTALAFLAWYVFAPQCLATLAVLRRESGSAKWMWLALIYLFALAYIAAGITYHTAQYFLS
jgi:ferrous iron transport protein B